LVIIIEPLAKIHDCKQFDCTEEWMTEDKDRAAAAEMNAFLQHHALDQAKKDISKTFVVRGPDTEEPHRVIAYYSTSVGHLQPQQLPNVVSARMTIPVVFLLRLAVDSAFQRNKVGSKLLAYFLIRLVHVARDTGVYALVLEALNERVRGFYERFGLRPLPGDANHMYIRINDIRAWLVAHGHAQSVA
jgi:GNAT superfamily N-acetyltransferase